MSQVSAHIVRRIRTDFPDNATADRVIQDVGAATDSERVQAAIVIWGNGDIRRIRDAAALARIDWRDVLVRADLADGDWSTRINAQFGGSVE